MGSSKLQCAKELNQAMVYPHGSAITPTGHGPIKPEPLELLISFFSAILGKLEV